MLKEGKKGQVTIFIIIALVIVGGVLLFFMVKGNIKIQTSGGGDENPNAFLEECLEDPIRESVDLLLLQGGYTNPKLSTEFTFNGESKINISYLCYTEKDLDGCVAQEPMLFNHLKTEIYDYIKDDVKDCVDSLGTQLDDDGYIVDLTYRDFEINLNPREVDLKIDAEIVLTKSGETTKKENFVVKTPSSIYNLALVVQEVVSREAENCDFNYIAYMFFYPEYKIKKIQLYEGSEIYSINLRGENEKFNLAVRGCVIPAGY